MVTKLSSADRFDALQQIAASAGDEKFLGQLKALQAAFASEDWRRVTLGCRVLYKLASDNGYLEKVEPILRPLFDFAKDRFEMARVAMLNIQNRLLAVAKTVSKLERIKALLER